MKRFLVILFVLTAFVAAAQNRQGSRVVDARSALAALGDSATVITNPDNDAIKKAIMSESSPYFYPRLFSRYIKGDSTLTVDDYRHLYYGYAYNDNYHPLETLNYSDSVFVTLSMNKNDSLLSPELFNRLMYFCDRAFITEPFNMQFNNIMSYAYYINGDTVKGKQYARRLNGIKSAIYSSGNGTNKSSPWHILYRGDIADLFNSFGVKYSKQIFVTSTEEYYHVPEREGGDKGYYFDTSRLYFKPLVNNDSNVKRKFEFNPYSNPKSTRYIKPNQNIRK